MNPIETSMIIYSWDSFIHALKRFDTDHWLFRGQKDSTWSLATSFERACKDYNISGEQLSIIERGMIRKFYRHLSSYGVYDIEEQDLFRIVSLMQHYYCPTRFLDFSHSPYSALFFALENVQIGNYSAIWAIDSEWLDTNYKKNAPMKYFKLLKNDKYEKGYPMMKFFFESSSSGIKHLGPYKMNDRITAQNGTFVFPLNISIPFADNLYFNVDNTEINDHIVKIIIDCNESFIKTAYRSLYNMGISRATLFPGIEGFASHLKMLMLLPHTISPPENSYNV